jgi:2-oxoglutarate ferredoxin oxidoreductase subunit alpha
MQKKLLWKIGGEAGFGIMTTGSIFGKNATRMGYHIYDYIEYPSLIRGGHNTYEVLVSDEPVASTQFPIDILLCLNRDTFELHKQRLHAGSIVIYDPAEFSIEQGSFHTIELPYKAILKEEKAVLIMVNNIALGASLALMGWDLSVLNSIIEESFKRKGQEVIDLNKQVAKRGFDHIVENYKDLITTQYPRREAPQKLILTGNDAFSIGAVAADCRFYCAYPMTPASSVLTTLAAFAKKDSMVVRHAEDEISVINTALGASFAGIRSAVGTSGGGFALMVEALSFAGVAEIGIVVFLSQRPGPATGMPTWTEQGDLLFAVHAGHGEFPKIVLAPGDVEEMYTMTACAFDMADIYQTPVIVMSDKLLSEGHESTEYQKFVDFAHNYIPNYGKNLVQTEAPYLRYKVTTDGISPRLIPGAPGHFYQTNSYEHLEDGHTTEEAAARNLQVEKRSIKMTTYLNDHFQAPQLFGNPNAKNIIVSWGGNKGAILEALKTLKNEGLDIAYLHFTYLYPMDENRIKQLFTPGSHYFLMENNSTGQFARLLREEVGISPFEKKLLKYDGRPIFMEEIIDFMKKNYVHG